MSSCSYNDRSVHLWISLAGIISAAIYLLVFVLPYQLSAYYALPLLDMTQLVARSNTQMYTFLAGWVILFALYYAGYRLCPKQTSRFGVTTLALFPIVFSLTLLFSYPLGASDIFEYIFHGHILAHYNTNPYFTTPAAFPGDPLLQYVFWKDLPQQYGPLWNLLSGVASLLSGSNLFANLVIYKLVVIGHFWLSIYLIYQILATYKPEQAMRGVFLFAWNPLLQFEFAGNGHNEAVLIFWMLLAVYWLVRRKHVLSLLALTAAILVKFIPVILLPLFLIVLWRAQAAQPLHIRFGRVVLALAAMGMLALILYLPFGLDTVMASYTNLSGRTQFFIASLPELLLFTVKSQGIADDIAQRIVRNCSLLAMAIIILWRSIDLLRRRISSYDELIAGVVQNSFAILFAYLSIACLWFQPWYVAWLLAFAPLIKPFGYAERTTLFCITAICNYFIAYLYLPLHWQQFNTVTAELLKIVVIYPLPLLLSLAIWLYPHRRTFSIRRDHPIFVRAK